MTETPQLTLLDVEKQRFYSELFQDKFFSIGHYSELVTIEEGRIINQLVNRKVCLSAQLSLHHDRPVQQTQHQSTYRSTAPFFPHM